ncbi:hypothetical protein BX265_6682 [Streptomyces sp. TLI_235]|nr:hypothetical protein [Streptomyces sp. TLI_235]PBC72066.1 hypothetical protein BX265_6682 [Streptomyces sp. TLI_235]
MDARTAVVPFGAARRRRAAVLAAGVALVLGGVAACGSQASTGADGAPSAQPTASASASAGAASPSPSAGQSGAASASPEPGQPTKPGIAVGEPTPTVASLPAVSYTVEGGTHLTVWFYGGVCEEYALRANEEAPGLVRVRVVVDKPAPRGKECPALAKKESVSAELAQPLGDRKVIDMTSGSGLTMTGDVPGGPR